jgi:hypothetical protein
MKCAFQSMRPRNNGVLREVVGEDVGGGWGEVNWVGRGGGVIEFEAEVEEVGTHGERAERDSSDLKGRRGVVGEVGRVTTTWLL